MSGPVQVDLAAAHRQHLEPSPGVPRLEPCCSVGGKPDDTFYAMRRHDPECGADLPPVRYPL